MSYSEYKCINTAATRVVRLVHDSWPAKYPGLITHIKHTDIEYNDISLKRVTLLIKCNKGLRNIFTKFLTINHQSLPFIIPSLSTVTGYVLSIYKSILTEDEIFSTFFKFFFEKALSYNCGTVNGQLNCLFKVGQC